MALERPPRHVSGFGFVERSVVTPGPLEAHVCLGGTRVEYYPAPVVCEEGLPGPPCCAVRVVLACRPTRLVGGSGGLVPLEVLSCDVLASKMGEPPRGPFCWRWSSGLACC